MRAPCVCGVAPKIPTRGVPKTFVNETAVPLVCQHAVAGSAVPRNACRYQRTKTGTGGRFWEAVIVISFAVLDHQEPLYLLGFLGRTSFLGTPWGTQESPRYRLNWLNTQHSADAE